MKTKTFTTIIYKEEDMYIAECPEIGTVDQGETIEEAIENLKEATKLYLEESSSICEYFFQLLNTCRPHPPGNQFPG
ncbi:MAG: type II toxin-antitoxin system HicB family antitoxin [Phormidium sp.]